MILNDTEFINLITEKEITDNNGVGLDKKLLIDFGSIVNTDSLILYIMDEWIDRIQFSCNDVANINIGLTGSFMVFSTALATAVFGILIDLGYSIENIAIFCSIYTAISIVIVLIFQKNYKPVLQNKT